MELALVSTGPRALDTRMTRFRDLGTASHLGGLVTRALWTTYGGRGAGRRFEWQLFTQQFIGSDAALNNEIRL